MHRSAVNLGCAAIAAVREQDENRTAFSIADFADADPISSVFQSLNLRSSRTWGRIDSSQWRSAEQREAVIPMHPPI
jgi:hypothetical protein